MAPVDLVIAAMPYTPATILQSSSSQPPLLSAGSITVTNLWKFKRACKRFFTYKEIPADKAVGCIIYSFKSEFMQSWIESDSELLIRLTFARVHAGNQMEVAPNGLGGQANSGTHRPSGRS
jgi:hypothetical protein